MSLLVVGSIALDSVKTPYGEVTDVLGGSAVYFAYAASFFAPVRVAGVVGDDFPEEHLDELSRRNVDVSGVGRTRGKTFRWRGSYEGAMNEAETLSVELNVLGEFDGKLPDGFLDSEYIFLANGPPALQHKVVDQVTSANLIVADTMNHWIRDTRDELAALLRRVDAVVLNAGEARQYTGEHNLPRAGRKLLEEGPTFVVIKKGEHGALLVTEDGFFAVPAYPSADVTDPTGAGDSFAGGMMGHLAQVNDTSTAELRRALLYGTVVASINVEDFSLERFKTITHDDIKRRYEQFRQMMTF
ncbi:MAG: sugar kinase [Planctomycetes bacterium DG_58]|nr:MAG: sugar kinase [Planctomycetes bacterium DG_58]KPK97714.1 MAG: sugar kinase [Planctomycetes bacterium SM23_65]